MLPNDPVMLLSYINTQLRDYYNSLDDLCMSIDLKKEELTDKLKIIDYHYNPSTNQFQ